MAVYNGFSYNEFIKYFDEINSEIKLHHLIISSHFVYGWMPTILKFKNTNIKEVLIYLNKARSNHLLSEKELLEIKACVNNSMVGTSKLLHFINPQIYAIWDSRVLRYINGNKYFYGID